MANPTEKNQTPTRVAALDLGKARVGIAVTDELGLLAHPRPALDGRDTIKLLRALGQLAKELDLQRFVVGYPLSMSGKATRVAQRAIRFCQKLAEHTGVEVELVDERLTTVQAERALKDVGHGRDARKARVDSASAALMLQQWIDTNRR